MSKNREYYELLKKIPTASLSQRSCKTSGKLIVCLIEFREMPEIEYVMNALFQVYEPEEIGIAIMFGNDNAAYIRERYESIQNIKLIQLDLGNITRQIYSKLLKRPQFYEHFIDFSHVLIYQTDALIFQKIPDEYFEFDYIGAPWRPNVPWSKYKAGNGGFSLRKVSAMIQTCESNRNLPMARINGSNEDILFASQDRYKYPQINSEMHKSFSVEQVYHPEPIGCHQAWHAFAGVHAGRWKDFLEVNIKNKLYGKNSLVFYLFSGVGFCNQLFSLELAVYLSNITKRKLVLCIKHPLVHCGKPRKEYGHIIDYLKFFSKSLPFGYDLHTYEQVDVFEKTLRGYEFEMESRVSNTVFVDPEFDLKTQTAFAHGRDIVKDFRILFDKTIPTVIFKKSNASRFFTNFLTNQKNVETMNEIAKTLSFTNDPIDEIARQIFGSFQSPVLAIHLRFGDAHKTVEEIQKNNENLERNLTPWISRYENVLIMTDRRDNEIFSKFSKKLIFTDDLITDDIKKILQKTFKNTQVAEFLIQKTLCELSDEFIGSMGSTASSHIQYKRYTSDKSFEKHTDINLPNFDKSSLTLKTVSSNEEFDWSKKRFKKGHPVSWQMLFPVNVSKDEKRSLKIEFKR